ncbi:Kazaltype serine protease inhibitor domain containing protein [Acanthamoeba castellanii str. Neff]|uniref:Kazaltype serine protease inhibitor domain containing protein n=1 Tax=Acanthamoeba castellanii (strain ATCC 30010 / Neff) TaxID=1257118 RepID=L8HLQ2_ACACF|nr:Kazaltype serine protease inhibitor domain containing protein [Acanthamoeba castellanii str. Neff]ELR25351.1 Kazaltype serine protease inhibitor domain containing protein [Acanthamoeba castellanii str. Neff]
MLSTTNRLLFVLGVALVLVGLAACDDNRAPPLRICRIADRSSACLRGEFCALPLGMCGEDRGTCTAIPQQCIEIFDPVCGCDGRTYGNECEARRNSVSGRVPPDPGPLLIERIDLFSEQLYATNGYGAPLDYNRVNWTFVERLIDTKNFRWEDYSPFSSAGIYTNIRTYWRALNRADDEFPLIGNVEAQWTTCDPFARRVVSQYREVYGRARYFDQWGRPTVTETSTSIYVSEFEPNGLRITKQAFWTSGNLIDLVRPQRDNGGGNGGGNGNGNGNGGGNGHGRD